MVQYWGGSDALFEYLFLQSHEHSGNQFLISNGVGFQSVGHYVVDVLDEDNVLSLIHI